MRRSVYEQLERDLTAARQAALEAERKDRELARLRCEHAAIRMSVALIRLQRSLARKYRPDQPRVPAGNPDGGNGRAGARKFCHLASTQTRGSHTDLCDQREIIDHQRVWCEETQRDI
jgi:hypothetical protein